MPYLGEALGNVSVLTNVTLKQLIEEAPVRWPTIWDENVERKNCLIFCKSKTREIDLILIFKFLKIWPITSFIVIVVFYKKKSYFTIIQ